MPLSRRCLWLLFIICGLPLACKSPSRSDAESWFKKHRPTFQVIEAQIKQALDAHPYDAKPFTCTLPASLPSGKAGESQKRAYCQRKLIQWHQAAADLRNALKKQCDCCRWRQLAGIKSVQIWITRPKSASSVKDPRPQRWRLGCTAWRANKVGAVTPGQGLTIDNYHIGWGQGRLSFSSGKRQYKDATYYAQIDVRWRFRHRGFLVNVEVAALGKSALPQAWRDAICGGKH